MYNIAIQTTDPCQDGNHTVMYDVEWRNSAAATTLAHCDRRLEEGWYRIDSKAGSDMPTSCPQMNRCGTVYPVWLDGKGHYSIFVINNACMWRTGFITIILFIFKHIINYEHILGDNSLEY